MSVKPPISQGWVTLLGGGDPRVEDLEASLKHAPRLVAADGAANHAVAAGHIPDLVIGDLDSLDDAARRLIPEDRIRRIDDQNSTDFEKCLSQIDAPLILATGFTSRRIDHALAVFNALIRFQDRPCVVFSADDVIFAAPPRIRLDLAPDTRVSLFPLTRVTGRSDGLFWPIDGLDFAPDAQIGTSNKATGPVELTFHLPGMLIILPRAALDAAIAAVSPDD